MGYSCSIVDTRTGVPILERLKPKAGTWQTLMNSIGQGQATFSLRDVEENVYQPATWRDASQQWHRTLVVSHDEVAVYAGVLNGLNTWDRDKGDLTLSHAEVRSLAARRFAAMLVTYVKTGKFAPANKTLRGLVTAVLREGFYKTPGDNWTLPFVIPADEAGSLSREWLMPDFESIEDMLGQLISADGGPDVALDPRWNANGHLQWHALVGTPRVAGVTHEWNLGAALTPVAGFKEQSDGSKVHSGLFGLGAGAEQDRLVGRSPLTGISGPPIPDMDGTVDLSSVKTEAELNSIATGMIRALRAPTVTHSFGLELGDPESPVDLSTMRLGARTKLHVPADEYVVDGERNGYVTSLGGDLSTTSLTVGVHTL